MQKQSLLRTGFLAALIIGSIAGAVSTSFAATSNPGGNSSTGGNGRSSGPTGMGGGGGGGNGGNGASMPEALISVGPNGCPPRVTRCNHRRPPTMRIPVKTIEASRCSNAWRLVELDDGTIIEDRSQPMRKTCRVIRRFD